MSFAHRGPARAQLFATVCVPYVGSCMHVMLDMDGVAFSCHHIHSRSQRADEALR